MPVIMLAFFLVTQNRNGCIPSLAWCVTIWMHNCFHFGNLMLNHIFSRALKCLQKGNYVSEKNWMEPGKF